MNLSIRHLRVFVAVAQTGSFAEAAQALHLTSPALSLVIKGLEEQAGFKVFDRTTRSVRLTPSGLALLPQAHRLLNEHRHLMQAVDSIRDQKAGIVRLASTQLLACTILPPAITRFKAQWPDIEVVPVDAHFNRVQEMLLRGDADLGIGPERLCDPDIVATRLFDSRLYVACSVHHRFAQKASVRWADLKHEPVILADPSAAPLMARDARYQTLFDNTVEVGHFTTALALANENQGVVVSAHYARMLIKPYALVLVPLVQPRTLRKVMAFRHRRLSLSPAAEQLMQGLGALMGGDTA